jgi:hypothetical protein
LQHVVFTTRLNQSSGFCLCFDGAVVVEFACDSHCARIVPHERFRVADLVRWAAPLGIATQGLILLHMSAVQGRDGVIGFMGPGGAGKSTLAKCIAKPGVHLLSDDVVLCNENAMIHTDAEPRLRRWCEQAASNSDQVDYADLAAALKDDLVAPLTKLFVVGPRCPGDQFELQPLGAIDALVQIANHRLGAHPLPSAWKNQFQVYTAIAKQVPIARLTMPEGLDRMRAALPQLQRRITRS